MKSLSIFLLEAWEELKKVVWPSRSDFVGSVVATIVVVTLFSFFFALVDGAIGYVVKSIIFYFTS